MEVTTSGQAGNDQKKKALEGKKPRPPPGIGGTVASLVIGPDWFAAKEENKREKFWWSPGKTTQKGSTASSSDKSLLTLIDS